MLLIQFSKRKKTVTYLNPNGFRPSMNGRGYNDVLAERERHRLFGNPFKDDLGSNSKQNKKE